MRLNPMTDPGRGPEPAERRPLPTPLTAWTRTTTRLRSLLRAAVSRMVWAGMALPVVVVVTACGGQTDDLSKQINEMQSQIRQLRASTLAAQDRLEALEQHEPATSAEGSEAAARAADRPELQVVRLVPDEDGMPPEPAAAPETESSWTDDDRPMLRGDRHGAKIDKNGGESRTKGGGASRSTRSNAPSRSR